MNETRRVGTLVLGGVVLLVAGIGLGMWLERSPIGDAQTSSPPTMPMSAPAVRAVARASAPPTPPWRAQPGQGTDAAAVQLRRLEAELRTQPRDPAWASQTETAIDEGMARALVANELTEPPPMNAECRSSGCRIVLGNTADIPGDLAAQWLLLELAEALPRAQVVIVPGPDGAPETHVFASR